MSSIMLINFHFHMPKRLHTKFGIKLEFMFMKHYAPNRCEPSIEALNFGGGEGVRAVVNGEVKFL